jgi:hypothetical protein
MKSDILGKSLMSLTLLIIANISSSAGLKDYCKVWNDSLPNKATWVWRNGDVKNCVAGDVNFDAVKDGLRRLNLFRTICGVQPVKLDTNYLPICNRAALMLAANQELNANPPTTWKCYNREAAEALPVNSIIGWYVETLSKAVDVYFYGDSDDATLSGRRELLYPELSKVSFGYVDGWFLIRSCQANNRRVPEFIAWPPNAIIPAKAFSGKSSFSVDGADFSKATVTIIDSLTGGIYYSNKVQVLSWYGIYSCAWNYQNYKPDKTYKIVVDSVQNADSVTYSYYTRLSSCSSLSVNNESSIDFNWYYQARYLFRTNQTKGRGIIKVFDLSGQLVFNQQILENQTIIKINLPSGLYFTQWTGIDNSYKARLIILN